MSVDTLKTKTLVMRKLEIIGQANQISQTIWEDVLKWDYFPKGTIGKQLCRAADSISANLSEAAGRYSYAERKQFCYYARGSLFETINWIEKAINRGLVESKKGEALLSELNILAQRLNSFINTLKQAKPPYQ